MPCKYHIQCLVYFPSQEFSPDEHVTCQKAVINRDSAKSKYAGVRQVEFAPYHLRGSRETVHSRLWAE